MKDSYKYVHGNSGNPWRIVVIENRWFQLDKMITNYINTVLRDIHIHRTHSVICICTYLHTYILHIVIRNGLWFVSYGLIPLNLLSFFILYPLIVNLINVHIEWRHYSVNWHGPFKEHLCCNPLFSIFVQCFPVLYELIRWANNFWRIYQSWSCFIT